MTKTAVALGYFDGLHLGHRSVISAATGSGLPTVVCTFPLTDAPGNHESPWLLLPERRAALLKAWGAERIAEWGYTEIRDLSPEAYFDRLRAEFDPALLCCGFNYRFGCRASGGVDTLRALCGAHGIRLRVIAPVSVGGEPVSSTRIRALITAGRTEEAEECLGRPFSLALPAQVSRADGRTVLTQVIPKQMVVPMGGRYCSVLRSDGEAYPAETLISGSEAVTELRGDIRLPAAPETKLLSRL